jgi:SAM-dependent methyltransferase
VEIPNAEMAKHWDGEEGDDWTEWAEQFDAGARYIWPAFTSKVPVAATDELLDVGCGTGRSTCVLAQTAKRALGVDLSTRMLDYARGRAADQGLTNVEFVKGDAQVHDFPNAEFDLAISIFGCMFFADPVAAFANVRSGLRPNARLAMLSWQPFQRNEWIMMFWESLLAGRDLSPPPPGAPGPFGLADPDHVHRILGDAGFTDIDLTALDAPQWLGATVEDAWAFASAQGIVRGLTGELDADTKRACLDRLHDAVASHLTPDGVQIGAAEWLITARA